MKRFLLVSKSAPYGTSVAKDMLDVALTCSVFEQPVSILLIGDGVLQLLPHQDSTPLRQKNLNALQDSLTLYDIDAIFVDQKALSFHGLTTDCLQIPCIALAPNDLQKLISSHDVILTF